MEELTRFIVHLLSIPSWKELCSEEPFNNLIWRENVQKVQVVILGQVDFFQQLLTFIWT